MFPPPFLNGIDLTLHFTNVLFIRSFIHLFIHQFMHQFMHDLIMHLLFHPLILLLIHLFNHLLMHLFIHLRMHLFFQSFTHIHLCMHSESDAKPSSSEDMLPVTPAMTPRPQRQVSLPSRSSPSCRLLPLWQRLFHLRRSAGWIKRDLEVEYDLPRLCLVHLSSEFVIHTSSEFSFQASLARGSV